MNPSGKTESKMTSQMGDSDETNNPRKIVINLPFNPPLANNESYVGLIISQKPVKASAIHSVMKLA